MGFGEVIIINFLYRYLVLMLGEIANAIFIKKKNALQSKFNKDSTVARELVKVGRQN